MVTHFFQFYLIISKGSVRPRVSQVLCLACLMQLEEAISFIKENTKRLLNTEQVTLYPVSARAALKAKLLASANVREKNEEHLIDHSHHRTSGFYDLEEFLFSFLDGSTSTGIERIKLKLETPIRIAEQLLRACQMLTMQDYQQAKKDLKSVNELLGSVKDYAHKMESESILWKRKTLSMVYTFFYTCVMHLIHSLNFSFVCVEEKYNLPLLQ